MSDISVIIRCKNEEQWIGHSIQSVIDKLDNPEIIIVNNNSTDDSMNVVKMFKKDKLLGNGGNYTNIKVYNIDNYSPGKSLNYGVQKCSNDIVLMLSAHSQIISLNFDKIKSKLNDNCVVWGRQIPVYRGKKISPRYVWSNFKDKDLVNYFCKAENRYFMHNAFCFYNKKLLLENLFDENLIGKEERYWINDRIKEGFKSYYDSEAITYHHYTDNGATWRGIG